MAAPATAELRPTSADTVGVYRPRRPRASPLYRLLERHFRELSLVWDERFASACGDWRAVIPKVVDQFLACGLLEDGFARIRCDTCAPGHAAATNERRNRGAGGDRRPGQLVPPRRAVPLGRTAPPDL